MLINRTKAIRRPSSREPAFEKWKPSDFQADPRPSRYFSSSLRPPKLRSSKVEKALEHTHPHCADAYHLTLRVQGLDAVKHHARNNDHGQVVRTRHDQHQVEGPSFFKNRAKSLSASACCIHDETSILVFRTSARPSVRSTHTLTRPRLGAPCSEFHCKPRKVRKQKTIVRIKKKNHRNKNTCLSRMLKTRNRVKQVTCTKGQFSEVPPSKVCSR